MLACDESVFQDLWVIGGDLDYAYIFGFIVNDWIKAGFAWGIKY